MLFTSSWLLSKNNPVFSIYGHNASILTLKLCAVGIMTSFQKRKRRDILNKYWGGERWQAEVEFTDTMSCLSFLRKAQLADLEVIPIHLIIGLVYVKLPPDPDEAAIMFGTFTVARLMCSMGFLPKCVRTAASIWSYLDTALLATKVCIHFLFLREICVYNV